MSGKDCGVGMLSFDLLPDLGGGVPQFTVEK